MSIKEYKVDYSIGVKIIEISMKGYFIESVKDFITKNPNKKMYVIDKYGVIICHYIQVKQ